MSEILLRPAGADDLEDLLTIYNWAVANTTATLDTDPRSHAVQIEWLEIHDGNPYPALVAEREGKVIGYASLSSYNRKAGYRTTAEVSLYVHPDWQGKGIGTTLMSGLIAESARGGFVALVSLISADNTASLRLHERFGFETVGTLRQVGRKFDRWVDVTFMQLLLPQDDAPGA